MKNSKAVILAIFIVTMVMGCKKETDPIIDNSSNTVTYDSKGKPVFPSSVSGAFYSYKIFSIDEDTTIINGYGSMHEAWGGSFNSHVDMGNVSASNSLDTTQLLNFNNIYQSTLYDIQDSSAFDRVAIPLTWKISGSSSFPAINYVDTLKFPSVSFTYSGTDVDTTNQIVVNVNTNSDYQLVNLVLYSGFERVKLQKTISGNSGSVVFNSNEWKNLFTNYQSLYSIDISVQSTEIGTPIVINSKNFYFPKIFLLTKSKSF